jgi:hypothetical protein
LAAAWLVILTLQLLTPAPQNPPQAHNAPVFAPSSLFAFHHQADFLLP